MDGEQSKTDCLFQCNHPGHSFVGPPPPVHASPPDQYLTISHPGLWSQETLGRGCLTTSIYYTTLSDDTPAHLVNARRVAACPIPKMAHADTASIQWEARSTLLILSNDLFLQNIK